MDAKTTRDHEEANSSKRFRLPACLLTLDILPIELYLLAEIVAGNIRRYTLFLPLSGDYDREERSCEQLISALGIPIWMDGWILVLLN
jgi:hypothetical protein